MLNYLFIIQLSLIMLIFFIYWVTDLLILINFGILYLLSVALLVLYSDSDILVSFLIIIDLGVFLVFIAFSIHLLKYLNNKIIYINILKNNYIFICVFFFLIFILTNSFNFDNNLSFSFCWFFFINYVNYYGIHFIFFFSDMNIFKEIYFNINSLEFILISILLLLSLLCIYTLLILLNKFINKNFIKYSYSNLINKKTNSSYFFKLQNQFSQYNVPATCRVFIKKKYDTKTNDTINNR